jgi:hypothetical protein
VGGIVEEFGMTDATQDQRDRAALDRLIRGFQISRMIRLAADLLLADRVAPEESRPVADLAAECKVNATPLLRILRALASFGIFRVTALDRISHSPSSLLLRTDMPGSMHYGARFWTGPGSSKPRPVRSSSSMKTSITRNGSIIGGKLRCYRLLWFPMVEASQVSQVFAPSTLSSHRARLSVVRG